MVLVRLCLLLLLLFFIYPSVVLSGINSDVSEEDMYLLLEGDCSGAKKVAELFREAARGGDIEQSLALKVASFLSQCTLVGGGDASESVQTSGLLEGGERELWSIQKSINSLQYYANLYKENIRGDASINQEIGAATRVLASFSEQMMSSIFSNEEVDISNKKRLNPNLSLSDGEQEVNRKINEWIEGRITEDDK